MTVFTSFSRYGAAILFLFTTSLLSAQACDISQTAGEDGPSPTAVMAVGQSFQACADGELTSVRFQVGDELSAQELTFRISAGGNTLTADYEQVVQFTGRGDFFVSLDEPFPVDEGATYAFSLLGEVGASRPTVLSVSATDTYDGGSAFTETDGANVSLAGDLNFTLSILPAACGVAQNRQTATATFRRDITVGQSFKACASGMVTQVKVFINGRFSSNFRFDISEGANTINPGYSQDFDARFDGDQVIFLDTPFPVIADSTYAFSVASRVAGSAGVGGIDMDVYDDGSFFSIRDGAVTVLDIDLFFGITIDNNPTPVSVAGMDDGVTNLAAFPNPSTGRFTLGYELTAGRRVDLEVLDLTGRVVNSRALGRQLPGRYQETISAVDLPTGLYLYRIRTEAGPGRARKIAIR